MLPTGPLAYHNPHLICTWFPLSLLKLVCLLSHSPKVKLAANMMIRDNVFAFEQDQLLTKMLLWLMSRTFTSVNILGNVAVGKRYANVVALKM